MLPIVYVPTKVKTVSRSTGLRNRPTSSCPFTAKIRRGSKFTITGVAGSWVYGTYSGGGRSGWVHKSDLGGQNAGGGNDGGQKCRKQKPQHRVKPYVVRARSNTAIMNRPAAACDAIGTVRAGDRFKVRAVWGNWGFGKNLNNGRKGWVYMGGFN